MWVTFGLHDKDTQYEGDPQSYKIAKITTVRIRVSLLVDVFSMLCHCEVFANIFKYEEYA